jgi:predicted amidohydrolase
MRSPLSLAVAQPRCSPCDVAANALAHTEIVRAAKARVALFPELSLTGYHLNAPLIAPDDPALAPLRQACEETGTVALAGAPVASECGTGASIGLLAIDGTGIRIAYRKRFLGGAEPQRFLPGTAPVVMEIDGWRLGLAICKDTGIPQHDADLAALGMDVYLAAVLEHDLDADITVHRAQRIATTHRVWVAVASFAGATGEGYDHAAGLSGIWSPTGELVARAGTRTGEWVDAVIS